MMQCRLLFSGLIQIPGTSLPQKNEKPYFDLTKTSLSNFIIAMKTAVVQAIKLNTTIFSTIFSSWEILFRIFSVPIQMNELCFSRNSAYLYLSFHWTYRYIYVYSDSQYFISGRFGLHLESEMIVVQQCDVNQDRFYFILR